MVLAGWTIHSAPSDSETGSIRRPSVNVRVWPCSCTSTHIESSVYLRKFDMSVHWRILAVRIEMSINDDYFVTAREKV
jgi:hypothetical protein